MTTQSEARTAQQDKSENEYQTYLSIAQNQDFSAITPLRILYTSGKDMQGRPVLVLVLKNLPAKIIDTNLLLLYFIFVMDKVVENDYVLVFVNTWVTGDNRPPFNWLRRAYSFFNRKYKKNLKALYIVHPTQWIKMTIMLLPFVSQKFWKKMVNIDDVFQLYKYIDKSQLFLPEEVFIHDRTLFKARPIFGVPLLEAVLYSNTESGLPIVFEKCVEYIFQRGLSTEGIFRLSASRFQIETLKTSFDQGLDVDLSTIDDPHAVAAILKLYLRELPEPPFTFSLYDSWISIQDANKDNITAWKSETRKLLLQLPAINRHLLSHLFRLLACVASKSDTNRMPAPNLAIIFGPNLIRSSRETIEQAFTHIRVITHLVQKLIAYQSEIFPAVENELVHESSSES